MINLLAKLNSLKLDNKKIFMIMLVSFVIICIDFTTLFKLQLRSIKKRGPEIIKLKEEINVLTKDLARLEDTKNKQPQAKDGRQNKKIISEDEIPLLLQEISGIANKNNVKISKISPSSAPSSKAASPPKESKAKEGAASGQQKFTPRLITLDLSCDYHHLGQFINDLENSKILIAVEGIKIINVAGNYLQQRINLVLKAYVNK